MSEVRVCENCGKKNPVSSLECEFCGYDISFCIPVEDLGETVVETVPENTEGLWTFTAVDDNMVSFVVTDSITIGRENCVISDYLNRSDFISRQHCKIYVHDNGLYLMDASTNGTYINGNRVEKLSECPLNIGDEVTFADIKFKISK
jgi:pSer/pThr/pTyr-binding forkhead associated (FHA) protein